MRYAFTALFVLIGLWIVVAALPASPESSVPAPRAAQPASPYLCGTLSYETNNAGQSIPYLVYRKTDGSLGVNALSFTAGSACVAGSGAYPCPLIRNAFPYYFGSGPVSVEGTPDAEHLTVTELSLATTGPCAA